MKHLKRNKLMDFLKQKAGKHSRATIKEETGMLGVFIPRRILEYVNLYCVAFQTTKSAFARSIVMEWFRTAKKEEDLIYVIHQKALSDWGVKKALLIQNKSSNGHIADSLKDYKEELKNLLKQKGIGDKPITKILEGIR